jgi:hypothetical protein
MNAKTTDPVQTTDRRGAFLRVFVVASLLLSLLSCLWSIATPVSAAPDEPAHLIKAASVVRGQFVGEDSPRGHIVEVPTYVGFTNGQTCYAFKDTVSADCIPEVEGDENAPMLATTTAGLYNPVYYLIAGWPSLIVQDESGIYAMRIASGIAVSLMLGAAFAAVSTWRRPTLPMIGLTIALTPMVLFLNGTVNPNSLETAATLTTFVALLTIVKHPGHSRTATLAAIVVIAASIAANTRGLSLIWLAFAVLVPFILIGRRELLDLVRRRSVRLAIAGTAVAALFAAVWVLTSNSLLAGAVSSGVTPSTQGVGNSPVWGFVWTLTETFTFAEGMIGIFGWQDTPAPLLVFFTWSLLAGGSFLLAFITLRGRALWFVVVSLVAVVLLPPLVQGAYITGGGIIWQGRYILPVFTCAVFAAAAALSDRIALSGTTRSRLLIAVSVLWVFAQFQSFALVLRRYAVGLDSGWFDLLSPEWSPPGGVPLVLAGYLVVAAGATAAMVVWLRKNTDASTVEPESRPAHVA